MKRILQLVYFTFISCVFFSDISIAQNALSVEQRDIFSKYENDELSGKVKVLKQKFYAISPKKNADEITKISSSPIYQIDVYLNKSGKIERIAGPQLTTITYKYNSDGNILEADQIGDLDYEYYRRKTEYLYNKNGKLSEKTESVIPYTIEKGKAIYDLNGREIRTKTEYKFNESGNITELIVYEKYTTLDIIYREQFLYDESGVLIEKMGFDPEGNISMKEIYENGVKKETTYLNEGRINRRIIYDFDGRPKQETGVGYENEINIIQFEYDSKRRLLEWSCYDSFGNYKELYTGIDHPEYCAREVYEYDSKGNRVGWAFYDKRGVISDRYSYICTYDKFNNWTKKAMVENNIGADHFVIVEREIEYY